MVNTCSVFGCKNRSGRDKKSFYNFPAIIRNQGDHTRHLSEKRRQVWITSLRFKDWTPSRHSRICSDHFHSGKPSRLYDTSNPDWAPSINLGYGKQKSGVVERYERARKRRITRKLDLPCNNCTTCTTSLQKQQPAAELSSYKQQNTSTEYTHQDVTGDFQEDEKPYTNQQKQLLSEVRNTKQQNTSTEFTYWGDTEELQEDDRTYMNQQKQLLLEGSSSLNNEQQNTSTDRYTYWESTEELHKEEKAMKDSSCQTEVTGEMISQIAVNLQEEDARRDNSCQTKLTGEIISQMCYVVF